MYDDLPNYGKANSGTKCKVLQKVMHVKYFKEVMHKLFFGITEMSAYERASTESIYEHKR